MVKSKDSNSITTNVSNLFSLVPSGVATYKSPQPIAEEAEPICNPDSFSDFFRLLCKESMRKFERFGGGGGGGGGRGEELVEMCHILFTSSYMIYSLSTAWLKMKQSLVVARDSHFVTHYSTFQTKEPTQQTAIPP